MRVFTKKGLSPPKTMQGWGGRGWSERLSKEAGAESSQPWLDEDRGGNGVVLRGNSMGQGRGACDMPEGMRRSSTDPNGAREPLGSGWMLLRGQ